MTVTVLAACSGRNKIPVNVNPKVAVLVQGTTGMNMGNVARVQVALLKSEGRFVGSSPEVFWQDAAQQLRDDLVSMEQDFMLFPGDDKAFDVRVPDEAAFLAVAVNFRDPEGDQWRVVRPVGNRLEERLLVTVNERTVTIDRAR